MRKLNNYTAVAESIDDCQVIIKYADRHNLVNINIIALSLESLEYLRQYQKISYQHIWEILDMNNIHKQIFDDSQKATDEWIYLFKNNPHNFFDRAAQYVLDVNTFYHDLTCIIVAKELVKIYKTNNWQYLSAPMSLILQSYFLPAAVKNINRNAIFKNVSKKIFIENSVTIKYIHPLDKIKCYLFTPLILIQILKKLFYDFAYIIQGKIKNIDNINKIIKKLPAKIDIIASGWGSNLSRVLSIKQLKKAIANKKITLVNIIWRPKKIGNFNWQQESNNQFNNVLIHEEIRNSVAYGPKLSMFPLYLLPKYLYQFCHLILIRWKRIYQKKYLKNTPLLRELFHYAIIRYDTSFMVFFAYRQLFYTIKLLQPLFNKLSPKIFIGSDSGSPDTRGELLYAKKNNIIALSAAHSYQNYSSPAYHYVADYILTHGNATIDQLIGSKVPPNLIKIIGNNHQIKPAKNKNNNPANIIIVTRSRYGLWSNFSSRHNIYHEQLLALISLLYKKTDYNIIIKSHPNGDLHSYYDLVCQSFGSSRVKHVKKCWHLEQFHNHTDIAVFLGECPSLYISALFINIPAVFITKSMSTVLKNLHYNYQGAGSVAADAEEAFEQINKIILNQEYKKQILQKQSAFIHEYSKPNPENNLLNFCGEILQI